MAFEVYIIYSLKLDKYYIGYTENLALRLQQHNTVFSTYTSKADDWVLKYNKEYGSRVEAHKIELEIKRKKSRKYIEWLINSVG